MQGNVVEITEFFDKFRIPAGFPAPEVVVEMGRFQAELKLLLQKKHSPQQCHGVGAAGDGADDRIPRANHVVTPDGGEHFTQHASTPGRRRWCTGAATGA